MGSRLHRDLALCVLCAGLVMMAGVVPAAGSAAAAAQVGRAGGARGCAAPKVGQVGCAALITPGIKATTAKVVAASDSAPAGYGPSQLQSAYGLDFSALSGGVGQTVAVVTAYDDATAESDMGIYRSEYGLPACTTANGCFEKVNATGGTSYPPAMAGWSAPTAESLDMISAICPNCHILLVEADTPAIPTTTDPDALGQAENEAVALGAKFIDNTVLTSESTYATQEPTLDSEYFDHPGVAITAPDGAGGYGTWYPAASPDVIAVGGTTLTQASGTTRGWTETAWSGTGSGCSAYEAKPAWQTDTGCTGRALNDVSADADNVNSPVAFYDTLSGDWVTGGGNDVSAAIIAAAYALAGTPASDSYPASYLYANSGGLNDITTGSNGTCTPTYLCTAGTGYDGPTGLGTPNSVSAFLSSYYQPITPARFLDTRNGTGGTTGPVGADATVKLQVAGAGVIPSADVTAVAVNVTATAESSSGIIDAYPDGTTLPVSSNLNYQAGTTIANLVIVPVGADGKIDFYNASGGTVQLIADVFGYFTSDAGAAGDTTYTPITPTRVLDTRNGTGAAKAKLAGGSTLAVQIGGANGIPSGISAVAINITAADETGSGWLEAYADGTTRPAVSNLQFGTQAIAEMAIVPVGADGKIDIYEYGPGISTDVVGDVSGYFTAGTAGEKYHAIPATRLVDTRDSKAVAADGTLAVSRGTTVIAPGPTLVLNVTAVDGTSSGVLTAYPAGTSRPGTSSLNYAADEAAANLAIMPTNDDSVDIYNASSGTVELVVDCQGYFSAG